MHPGYLPRNHAKSASPQASLNSYRALWSHFFLTIYTIHQLDQQCLADTAEVQRQLKCASARDWLCYIIIHAMKHQPGVTGSYEQGRGASSVVSTRLAYATLDLTPQHPKNKQAIRDGHPYSVAYEKILGILLINLNALIVVSMLICSFVLHYLFDIYLCVWQLVYGPGPYTNQAKTMSLSYNPSPHVSF